MKVRVIKNELEDWTGLEIRAGSAVEWDIIQIHVEWADQLQVGEAGADVQGREKGGGNDQSPDPQSREMADEEDYPQITAETRINEDGVEVNRQQDK